MWQKQIYNCPEDFCFLSVGLKFANFVQWGVKICAGKSALNLLAIFDGLRSNEYKNDTKFILDKKIKPLLAIVVFQSFSL